MKAWEILSRPEKWTHGTMYKDQLGNEVLTYAYNTGDYEMDRPVPMKPEAVFACCAVGALGLAYDDEGYIKARRKLMDNLKKTGHHCSPYIYTWNDLATYEQVYNKLKELDL